MNAETKVQDELLYAKERGSHWLEEANAAKQRGDIEIADVCLSRSQFWKERYRRLTEEA